MRLRRRACHGTRRDVRAAEQPTSTLAAFVAGFDATWTSVFSYVLFGTYVGIGALAHDFGFSVGWALASTVLVWAGPAQVILISTLGAGGSLIEAAIAVTLSSVRLLPMVVTLLPMLKRPGTRAWSLVLPAHFTATSIGSRHCGCCRACRASIASRSATGLGTGYLIPAITATVVGYYLAARLPPLMSAALLFLTPVAFLMSILRNSRMLVDRLALAFGLVAGPLFAYWQIGLDLLWSGIAAGTAAFVIHRVREAMRVSALSGEYAAYSGADPCGLSAERSVALARRSSSRAGSTRLRDHHLGEGGRNRDPRRRDREAHDLRARRARDRAEARAARRGRDRRHRVHAGPPLGARRRARGRGGVDRRRPGVRLTPRFASARMPVRKRGAPR